MRDGKFKDTLRKNEYPTPWFYVEGIGQVVMITSGEETVAEDDEEINIGMRGPVNAENRVLAAKFELPEKGRDVKRRKCCECSTEDEDSRPNNVTNTSKNPLI